MDGGMDGWMDGQTDGGMDGWTDGRIKGCMNRLMKATMIVTALYDYFIIIITEYQTCIHFTLERK